MATEVDALAFSRELRRALEAYLVSANAVSDSEPELRQEVAAQIMQAGEGFFRQPLVHALPVYHPDLSVGELARRSAPPHLHSALHDFDDAPDRPLYRHQVAAIRVLQEGRSAVVATGTGSGKTEAFLLPILDDLCRSPGPGVRAILIYPLNALANDQLDRLRTLLRGHPDITFGRYTGETPNTERQAQQSFAGARREAPLPNERLSREAMHGDPPQILITNFAMLEYLLIRPADARLFTPPALRFVVLDEAHTYRGAQAIEIGLLLRRLRHGFAGRRLQFVLTSATLGDAGATDEVREFARRLTGLEFAPGDVLTGERYDPFGAQPPRVPGPTLTLAEASRLVPDDAALEGWVAALDDSALLASRIGASGCPTAPAALTAAAGGTGAMLDAFLRPLRITARLHALTTEAARPLPVLAEALWGAGGETAVRCASWLLVLAARARPRGAAAPPLVPARLHYVLRGLSGATICLNPACPRHAAHPLTAWSAVFLVDRAHCPACGSSLLPLATCAHCGQPYVTVVRGQDGRWQQHAGPEDDEAALWLHWAAPAGEGQEEPSPAEPASQVWRFCLHEGCHRILPAAGPAECCPAPQLVALTCVPPSQCVRCGGTGRPFPTVARHFRTADDAATSVVAETLLRLQPPLDAKLPAGGRRLLAFSDSRQRAAFFVPYLTRTSAESAIRADLYRAFRFLDDGSGPPDFARLVRRYAAQAQGRPVQTVRRYDTATGDDAYDVAGLRSLGPQEQDQLRVTASVTLLEEVCGSPWRQQRLLAAGLAAPEIFLSPEDVTALVHACPELAAGADGYDAVQALLGFFLRWTAVTLPEGVHLPQVLGVANLQGVQVALEEQGTVRGIQVRRWNPYRAHTSRPGQAIARSTLLGTLERLADLDRDGDEARCRDILDRLWQVARDREVIFAAGTDPHYQIRHERIVLTAARPFYRCPVCGAVTVHPHRGRCLLCGRSELRPLRPDDVPEHRRARYGREPLAIVVREHTAQIDLQQGQLYQHQFREGSVNVLSSSTTFELGIDVGQLKVVLLRNVPPTASQYVQRAGRAGRRTEGAAFAVTYARSAPHDQYHYQRPEGFIEGTIRPPRPDMRNEVLAQRHVQSYLLGRFLRQVALPEGRLTAGPFFALDGLALQAEAWWAIQVGALASEVADFLPAECRLPPAAAVREAADALRRVRTDFTGRLQEYEREKDVLFERLQLRDLSRRDRAAVSARISDMERLIDHFSQQPLIDHLSEAHWLPGYAFPQDVVRLQVRQQDGAGLRLARDREYGISEYAPGAEVVADGKVLRSMAVELGRAGVGEVREYRTCRTCGRIALSHSATDLVSGACPCGDGQPGRARPFIVPTGFSTLVLDRIQRPNISRQLPPPNAEVRQIRGVEDADFKPHPDLPGIACGWTAAGEMFVANRGPQGRAFELCLRCGGLGSQRPHYAPWGTPCDGEIRHLDLAHAFRTHTLELRFPSVPAPPIVDRSFWFSLSTGLHVGACEHLGIEAADIGVTSRPHGGALQGQLVVYDRIPGGAGYTRDILEALPAVLDATWRRLDACPDPGCDRRGSCYSCLRSNRNQYRWDELVRGPVADWLAGVLGTAR